VARTILPAIATVIAACGASAEDWPEGHPKIDDLRFAQQSPQDPYALEFLIRFSDTDGDTGRGTLHLLLDDEASSELPMGGLFESQSPPLALDLTMGELEVVVRVSTDVDIGAELKFGFFIEDAAGNESNDPWVSLRALEGS
jgi:hypothetical protein